MHPIKLPLNELRNQVKEYGMIVNYNPCPSKKEKEYSG